MIYPLSQTQMGIYVTCMNTQEEGNYNIDMLYRLDVDVDLERLANALDKVIEAHLYVKSRLVTDDNGEVVFEDHSADEFHTSIFEVNDIEDVRSHLGEDYDLMNDRLFRIEIYKTQKGNYLYVDFHHIIFDGMSWAVFTEDLEKAYAEQALEKETVNGFQIAEQELAERGDTQAYADAKQWYTQEFGGATEVDSMPLADIYGVDEVHYSREYIKLNVDKAAIDTVCEKAGVRESMLFTAAFGLTLSKYAAEDEVLYNTAFHGRNDKQTRRSFCMMVKTLPVYHNLTTTPTVVELLRQTSGQIKASRQNAIYSYGDIATELGVKSDINFAYQGTLHNLDVVLNGKRQQAEDLVTNTPGIKFLNMIMVEDGSYYAWCEYQNNKYSQEFIRGFWAVYEHILGEMCVKENLSDIEVCNAEQIAQLDSFNNPIPEQEEETVLGAFQQAAKQYPNHIAAVFKDKKYTYKELDELTDKIGSLIYTKVKECGKAEPVVSILIPRNEYMFILPLAAMKAGCAYQPLDPSYPQDRLNFMVKDADAAVLIADPELRDIVNEYEDEVILTSELGVGCLALVDSTPHPTSTTHHLTPNSLLILLYTSGSTGVPKGVMLEHHQVMAYVRWYQQNYEMTPESVGVAYASFGFDANMMDLYTPLTLGATVCIIPEEIRLDLVALRDFMNDNGVTHAFMTTQVAQQFALNVDGCKTLKHLTMGGEKMMSMNPHPEFKLHNIYGPTECSVAVTHYEVNAYEHNIPIGGPTYTTTLKIVDKNWHRVPVGAAGELWINGPQVGRGYLNRPEKTAEAFVEHEGKRWYRTGDIVRYREDGNIEFVGRKDGQVKIRGFRIELKEVEAVIRDFPGINDVTVQAFDDPNGGKFIAAYVVSDNEVDINALNDFILDQKPPYMVPAVTMQIEKIPLNVNQKVDKKALPKPEAKQSTVNSEQVIAAPLNALEVELKAIIASVVNNEDFGITDILGYVGLTSISGIKLATLIYKKYGVQVNAKTLAKTGTLQSIENEILHALVIPAIKTNSQRPTPTTQQPTAPLSFTQQGVYTECMANPGATQYNIPMCVKMPLGINSETIAEVVQKVVSSHPYIWCHFVEGENGEVVQKPLEDYKLDIPVKQLTAEQFELEKKDFVRPFNLAEGPLFRFEIVESANAQHPTPITLLADFHHLISDGASVDLFMSQLCQALDGAEIEKESYTYYDFVADEHISQETEDYFADRMARVEDSSMLIPDVFEKDLPHTERNVSAPTDHATVKAWAAQHGVTPAAVYLSAAYLCVARYLCEDNVNLCTISNGRSNLRIAETMGMFVNTLVLQSYVDNSQSCVDFVMKSAEDFASTIDNENYPFARIASKYGYQPNISFAYQVGVLNEYSIQEGKLELESLTLDTAKIGVNIVVTGNEEVGYQVKVEYDSALYTSFMMQQLAISVENAVQGLISKDTLSDVSITNSEQWNLLDSFNPQMDFGYNHDDTVVTAFKRLAQQYPDQKAVVYRDVEYTYGELDRYTDRLAVRIRERMLPYIQAVESTPVVQDGTKLTDVVVSILIHRNEWMLLASLAVLKAGCGYQPLDPSYPQDRLNFMAKDASARLLIVDEDLRDVLNEYEGDVMLTKDIPQLIADVPEGSVDYSRKDGLVTLLYTSGSTGVPKGCMLEHRNLVAFGHATRTTLDISTKSRIAAYASFGFDVNMMDMYCSIMNGGTMYIIPEDMRMNLDVLHDYMEEVGITQIFMTTQVGVQYLENYPESKSLRRLAMGGEKLRAVDPSKLSYNIYNGYGPSEMTCGVSMFTIEHWEPNIPIGRPMATLQGYVIDKTGHRLPVGAAGELWITGPQVARGYLNRVDKTREAFSPNPFVDHALISDDSQRQLCSRIYHSGDIVRYRENGDIEFVGRKDGQVKVRGFRIELKEVEAVIRDFEGVKDVTVQAYDYEDGGKYIAAFVVSEGSVDVDALNAFIKSQKPPYMVPAVTMQIDKIPLNVNQKVDKKALPKPEAKKADYVAPKNKTEEDFCQIFSEVTGVEKVSAEDDFFEIGGSSILALKVVLAAGKMGYAIVYNDVFSYTTPRMMAAFVGGGDDNVGADENVDDNADAPIATVLREIDEDGFDYKEINAMLRGNTLEAFTDGEKQTLGDVLLTGGTGFLGVHVLHDLIENYDGTIYCLVRGNKEKNAQTRLEEYLTFYHGKSYSELIGKRIIVIEGDATDPATFTKINEAVQGKRLCVINCAACVKHFAKGNEIEQINVGSVRNIVTWCIETGNRLVHVSTESVFGNVDKRKLPEGFIMDEHILYFGQEVRENQYCWSKFKAEVLIYDAILHHGLNAKVMRVGNLAPRFEDGGFQINAESNNMMNLFKAYITLGKIPFDQMDSALEFSPINYVARSILLLSQTPKECVCFMPSNHHIAFSGDIVMDIAQVLERKLEMVEGGVFSQAVQEALANPDLVDSMRPFMAYQSSAADSHLTSCGPADISNVATRQVLYRFGFRWPLTGAEYIERFVNRLWK